METDPQTRTYLEEVAAAVKTVTGDLLLGLYASGSLSLGDYDLERSDIDLLGVLRQALPANEKAKLREALAHDRLPCPARGLDFCLVTADAAGSPPRTPRFEFAMSTGHTWRLETTDGEADAELLLHFAVGRQSGIPLLGPAPHELFAPVPRAWILEELTQTLRWHATRIFDPYHDPLGQFSTLNACRAWYFAEHNAFCSKTRGGRWMLSRDPGNSLVAKALANRTAGTNETPERGRIEAFLRHVCQIIESAESTRRSGM